MKNWKRLLIFIISAVVLVGVGSIITIAFNQSKHVLPAAINNKLAFSPLVISDGSKIIADQYRASNAQKDIQTLSFRAAFEGKKVSVTEQVQPGQFTDVADYKSHFLSSAFTDYRTVQTANGSIYVGPASKLQDQQIGVMVEKGLLVFFYPSKDLTDQDWRLIGDSLTVENTSH